MNRRAHRPGLAPQRRGFVQDREGVPARAVKRQPLVFRARHGGRHGHRPEVAPRRHHHALPVRGRQQLVGVLQRVEARALGQPLARQSRQAAQFVEQRRGPQLRRAHPGQHHRVIGNERFEHRVDARRAAAARRQPAHRHRRQKKSGAASQAAAGTLPASAGRPERPPQAEGLPH